jgi:Abi-like protein
VGNIYQQAIEQQLDQALSLERFQRYLDVTQANKGQAFALYAFNMQVSEALYIPIHMLEVAMRNRFHTVLSAQYGENWFEHPHVSLSETQIQQLENAKNDLMREGKEVKSGRMIAALTFGFWTSLLSSDAENLWQQVLHRSARHESGKGLRRKDLSKPLLPIRVLRNRISHHEPVFHWNLPRHYASIQDITRWLSPIAADWSGYHSRFESVWAARPACMDTLILK